MHGISTFMDWTNGSVSNVEGWEPSLVFQLALSCGDDVYITKQYRPLSHHLSYFILSELSILHGPVQCSAAPKEIPYVHICINMLTILADNPHSVTMHKGDRYQLRHLTLKGTQDQLSRGRSG